MLVLTRKPGEKLRLGKDIVITVVKVKGQAVRIGIEAPRDLSVVREELLEVQRAAESEDGHVVS